MIVGLTVVLVLAAVCGWLGYRAWQGHRADQQRALFIEVAKQTAVNLTTVDYNHAEADVRRILNSATGVFHDDFARRSSAFVDVVEKTLSSSSGTVTEAGVESMSGDEGRVLVALTVMTSNRGQQQPQPRYWRMRLTVTKTGEAAKVSQVDFP